MSYLESMDLQAEMGLLQGASSVPGTPIAAAISTSLAETAAFMLFRNTDTRTLKQGGLLLILKYLRFVCRVAPASATSLQLAISQDDINRYSSGGSQIPSGSSRSDQLDATLFPTKGRLDAGALVLTAAGTRRRWITQKILKNAIPVVGDEFVLLFGELTATLTQLLTGAASQTFSHVTDPVVLLPGGIDGGGAAGGSHSLPIHVWEPGNAATAGTYDIEAGWLEHS